MTGALLGLALGVGLVLMVSPWLWPRTGKRPPKRPSRVAARIRSRMAQAGLGDVPLLAIVLVSLLCATVVAAIAMLTTGIVALAPIGFAVGLAAPILGLAWRARSKRKQMAAVWPEVIDHITQAVRSGLAIPEALAQVAKSGPAAVRGEFTAFAADYRATGRFDYSVDRLKDALADPVADRLIETLRMAREVGGGEVGAVLRQLGSYLRVEQAIRGEILARQSWVVYAARLGLIAPWLVLLALSFRPEAAVAYNTPGGAAVIVGGAAVTVIAYRVMIAIGRLPEDERSFA